MRKIKRINLVEKKDKEGKEGVNLTVKHKQESLVKVTHKQLWNDLIKVGINKDQIDKKPNYVFVNLW